MKTLLPILCFVLASCATKIPRAIIPPPSVIAELNVNPVADAATRTRDAVRGVSEAGTETRKATESLRNQIDRTAEIAAPYPDLTGPFAELRRRADILAARVMFAEEKEKLAIATVDELTTSVSKLEADNAAQKIQIHQAKASESTLRTQVEALSESADKRVIAEDKLRFWRKAALWTWGILLTLFLIGTFLRPRIF